MIIKFPVSNPFEMGLCAKCLFCSKKRYTRTNEVICTRKRMFGVCNEWELARPPRELRAENGRVYEVAANG